MDSKACIAEDINFSLLRRNLHVHMYDLCQIIFNLYLCYIVVDILLMFLLKTLLSLLIFTSFDLQFALSNKLYFIVAKYSLLSHEAP